MNQTQVCYKNTVHQMYTWASVQKRYCNKSYYTNNFTETVLLREIFPKNFCCRFYWGRPCRSCFRSNLIMTKFLIISEAYSEPCQSLRYSFTQKIVNDSKPFAVFAKNFVLELSIFLFTVNNVFIFLSAENQISVKYRSILKTS